MKSKAVAFALAIMMPLAAGQWQLAKPGYRYQFPQDYFDHPAYKTEWWYYTGNLHAPDGQRFGFELTFFRQGVDIAAQEHGVWDTRQVYLAHLALSDIDGQRFFHQERLNRAGPGLAEISLSERSFWNGNWKVRWISLNDARQQLEAICDQFQISLDLKPEKAVVVHGKDGISQKGPEKGESSHYLSFTRMGATGKVTLKERVYQVDGLAWMDHEFFTQVDSPTLAGWDWFAIQLDNYEEVMIYRLRQKSGAPDPFSSGTLIDAQGTPHFLEHDEFDLSAADEWQSPSSHARYPLSWRIRVPRFGIDLTARTELKQQELSSNDGVSPTYWEGAMQYTGEAHSKAVKGVGYLEMTGYDKAFQIGH